MWHYVFLFLGAVAGGMVFGLVQLGLAQLIRRKRNE